MGTAGGVKNVTGSGVFDETFVVVMGDALTDVDVREAAAFREEEAAPAAVALTPVEDTTGFGVAALDGEGRITDFQEGCEPTRTGAKPAVGESETPREEPKEGAGTGRAERLPPKNEGVRDA